MGVGEMPMLQFIQEILILFIIALIGYLGAYRGVLNKKSDSFIMQFVLNITLPALILYSMNLTVDLSIIHELLLLLGLSILVMVYSIVMGIVLSKKLALPESQDGVFQSLIIFGNQGFIGYAVVYMLFGEIGIIYAAIYNICFLITIWTYGVYIVAKTNKKTSLLPLLKSPGLLATLFGIILLASTLYMPDAIHRSLEYVGMMTIPLSMIIIGSVIEKIPIRKLGILLKNKFLWMAAMTKLVFIPLLLIPILAFEVSSTVATVAILIAAMPSGPTTTLFAEKYNRDVEFSSVGVSLSTLLSILTLPFIYGLLLYFS